MSFEYSQQSLKAILEKCFKSGELRKILAKEGIPESEPATLSIKCVDNDMDIVTDFEIPTTSPEIPVAATTIDFDQEIRDFLNQADTSYGLLCALPKSESLSDGTTRTDFEWTFNSSSKALVSQRCICCYPCRNC